MMGMDRSPAGPSTHSTSVPGGVVPLGPAPDAPPRSTSASSHGLVSPVGAYAAVAPRRTEKRFYEADFASVGANPATLPGTHAFPQLRPPAYRTITLTVVVRKPAAGNPAAIAVQRTAAGIPQSTFTWPAAQHLPSAAQTDAAIDSGSSAASSDLRQQQQQEQLTELRTCVQDFARLQHQAMDCLVTANQQQDERDVPALLALQAQQRLPHHISTVQHLLSKLEYDAAHAPRQVLLLQEQLEAARCALEAEMRRRRLLLLRASGHAVSTSEQFLLARHYIDAAQQAGVKARRVFLSCAALWLEVPPQMEAQLLDLGYALLRLLEAWRNVGDALRMQRVKEADFGAVVRHQMEAQPALDAALLLLHWDLGSQQQRGIAPAYSDSSSNGSSSGSSGNSNDGADSSNSNRTATTTITTTTTSNSITASTSSSPMSIGTSGCASNVTPGVEAGGAKRRRCN